MTKLRKLLTEQGIEWHDASATLELDIQIDRTHFDYRDYFWSVINGFGTYGGYDHYQTNKGLLELVSNAVNGGEPVGFLTAEQAIKLILED